MQTILKDLSSRFQQAIQHAFPQIDLTAALLEITQSTQIKFGHYQCNSAMKLAGQLQKKPREIAEAIVAQLMMHHDNADVIAECTIAGPGFINIRLQTDYLAQRVQKTLRDPMLGVERVAGKPKVIIDFSSPNTAKEMQVWHLRSTIIGDCLARLFEFLGYDVLRLNHVGDWGTAFGMLIAYMKEQAPAVLQGQQQTNLTHLVAWYREAKQQFDEDANFKKRSQQEVVALQSGEADSRKAWEIICEISRQAYQEIYDLLDVHLIERGESFYNPLLAEIIADLEKKQLITVSDGAKCIFLEGFTNREGEQLPFILQKSDGGYNYSTTDMAAIRQRIHEEKGQRLIYVTDAGQTLHFQMLFKAAERAHYSIPVK